uniref:Uncharacterized protein n=1 Tax=uncultured marine group II/III euryarchaeote AD1000_22_H02 TaxID=1457738 RepID=A0A075FLN8_9EURY|nr:hypothetical protein [uncultured marine group II/III euryarchaeote AD1000_22_H02]
MEMAGELIPGSSLRLHSIPTMMVGTMMTRMLVVPILMTIQASRAMGTETAFVTSSIQMMMVMDGLTLRSRCAGPTRTMIPRSRLILTQMEYATPSIQMMMEMVGRMEMKRIVALTRPIPNQHRWIPILTEPAIL